MNIVYFNNPLGTEKINFTITDLDVATLKKNNIIPKKSATLVKQYNEKMTDTAKSILVHIDKVVFDDYTNPTRVSFDMDLIKMFFLDIHRQARDAKLQILDRVQMRAMIKNDVDLISDIENDKNKLRNLPDVVAEQFINQNNFFKINKIIPNELLIDYESKYNYRLK
jgi:hypothetical protein